MFKCVCVCDFQPWPSSEPAPWLQQVNISFTVLRWLISDRTIKRLTPKFHSSAVGGVGARADAKRVTLNTQSRIQFDIYLHNRVVAERHELLLHHLVCKLDYRAVHLRFIRSLVCLVPQTFIMLLYMQTICTHLASF